MEPSISVKDQTKILLSKRNVKDVSDRFFLLTIG